MFYGIEKATVKSWAIRFLFWIGSIFIAVLVTTYVQNPFGRLLEGPKNYKVYFVGNFKDKNEDPSQIKKAFDAEARRGRGIQIGGVDVAIEPVESSEINAASVSSDLAKRNDALMVIGHFTSTATQSALPNYLHADPPIPVILVTETNPQLLPWDYKEMYYPVFRLSPTDDEQAKRAAKFIHDRNAKAIWVVEDVVTNTAYSNYLAQAFVKEVHQLKASKLKTSKVLLWTTNLEHPPADAVKALKIDWVFFAGHWSNCLILIRQANEIWKDNPLVKPNIMLSNSCASKELLQDAWEGGDDMKQVYLTHPMRATDFNTTEGFGLYGKLAYQLLEQLIQASNEKLQELHNAKEKGRPWYNRLWYSLREKESVHRIAAARRALYDVMEQAVRSKAPFDLDEDHKYTFDIDGTGKNISFQVWQVQKVGNELKFNDIENGNGPVTGGSLQTSDGGRSK
ncbi:MAG: ABC transporter substrate-binding protein [Pseudomonadota bacterium]|nr:ABC transporter substrate-binding protein [Pseudomonadota bacterium]